MVKYQGNCSNRNNNNLQEGRMDIISLKKKRKKRYLRKSIDNCFHNSKASWITRSIILERNLCLNKHPMKNLNSIKELLTKSSSTRLH